MSELKPFNSERIYWAVEQVEREAGDIDDLHLDDNLFYLKSEADKEIADLIEKNKRLANKDMIMASETIKGVFDELRHHKYKRCLAMAKWCHSMWILLRDENETKRSVFYWRWWNLWNELAEKFKLNNSTAQ